MAIDGFPETRLFINGQVIPHPAYILERFYVSDQEYA
jgi:hypothetical protein